MINIICVEKSKSSKAGATKRLKFLPRIGIYVDFAGMELTYRQLPLLEALVNLKSRGFKLENLASFMNEEMKSIQFRKPNVKAPARKKKA